MANDRSTIWVFMLGAIILCGIPGLMSLCCGVLYSLIGLIPGSTGSSDLPPQTMAYFGIVGICVGVLFIAVPLAAGYYALRRRPEPPVKSWDEPIPPAI